MNRAERRRRTRVVKARAYRHWRMQHYPWKLRGVKAGVHEYANLWHRADRARVRDALRVVDTCDPDVDIHNRATRHSAEWDMW